MYNKVCHFNDLGVQFIHNIVQPSRISNSKNFCHPKQKWFTHYAVTPHPPYQPPAFDNLYFLSLWVSLFSDNLCEWNHTIFVCVFFMCVCLAYFMLASCFCGSFKMNQNFISSCVWIIFYFINTPTFYLSIHLLMELGLFPYFL